MGGLLGCMAMEKGQPILIGVIVGILTGAFWGFVNGALTPSCESIHLSSRLARLVSCAV